jgi:hypothetical protein
VPRLPEQRAAHDEALRALQDFGGCTRDRAEDLVRAWRTVAANEAVDVIAGRAPVSSTISDGRLERLNRLVHELATQAAGGGAADEADGAVSLPNEFEVASLLRITEMQARTLLRNWRARYPGEYERRMSAASATGTRENGGSPEAPTWVIEYDDQAVFDYAVDRLRRYGISKGVKVDRAEFTIEVSQDTRTQEGQSALQVLWIP